uniref:TBC/LysM-associated domain containing 2 n=1 Tax=Aquila chrysaetos chrysaetos TaxID=223781 RepID=A0A663DYX4_AQUCH
MLTSTCPQPDQDEELPVGCGELAREGQPGWEGAAAAAPALEEPCRLALSTPSSILQDREIQEVRDSTRTPTHTHLPCAWQPWPLFCQELPALPQLGPHLPPPRLTQQPWHLLCCTRQDSFSLRTLYQFRGQLGSPTLLLIRDTEAQPGPPQPSSVPCRTGTGLGMGMLRPSPQSQPTAVLTQVFRWTGRNNFFVKGDIDLLMIGGGSKFGLWLDRDLHYSGSHPCETFDNETLSPWEEFCVQDLEVWGLA